METKLGRKINVTGTDAETELLDKYVTIIVEFGTPITFNVIQWD